jgi:hypothetical protein
VFSVGAVPRLYKEALRQLRDRKIRIRDLNLAAVKLTRVQVT